MPTITLGPPLTGAATDLGDDTSPWSPTFINNVALDNGSEAENEVAISGASSTLRIRNFGFNIPLNAIINSVNILMNRYCNSSVSAGLGMFDSTIRLTYNNLPLGDNNPDSTAWPVSSSSYITYSHGLWGAALTPAIINDPTFGVD